MPFAEIIHTPQSLHIAVWQLNEDLPQLLLLWGDGVLPEDFNKAASDKRRREILATALLLRHYWGCDMPLQHAHNGAPIINQGYISISHTASYVVAAFHPTRRIGVDIEILGTKATRVVERFLSSREVAALPDDSTLLVNGLSSRSAAIHLAWSVKEAIYKIHPDAVEFREDIILEAFEDLPDGCVVANLPAENCCLKAYYTLYNDCSLAWTIE